MIYYRKISKNNGKKSLTFILKDTIRHGYLNAYDSFVSSDMAKTI